MACAGSTGAWNNRVRILPRLWLHKLHNQTVWWCSWIGKPEQLALIKELVRHIVVLKCQPVCESTVCMLFHAGGGCCDSGPFYWPGSCEAKGPTQQPAGATPKGCAETVLCTGTHTHTPTPCFYAHFGVVNTSKIRMIFFNLTWGGFVGRWRYKLHPKTRL